MVACWCVSNETKSIFGVSVDRAYLVYGRKEQKEEGRVSIWWHRAKFHSVTSLSCSPFAHSKNWPYYMEHGAREHGCIRVLRQ